MKSRSIFIFAWVVLGAQCLVSAAEVQLPKSEEIFAIGFQPQLTGFARYFDEASFRALYRSTETSEGQDRCGEQSAYGNRASLSLEIERSFLVHMREIFHRRRHRRRSTVLCHGSASIRAVMLHRLTRRWSQRRTAVRSAFEMTSTLPLIDSTSPGLGLRPFFNRLCRPVPVGSIHSRDSFSLRPWVYVTACQSVPVRATRALVRRRSSCSR